VPSAHGVGRAGGRGAEKNARVRGAAEKNKSSFGVPCPPLFAIWGVGAKKKTPRGTAPHALWVATTFCWDCTGKNNVTWGGRKGEREKNHHQKQKRGGAKMGGPLIGPCPYPGKQKNLPLF